MATEILHKRGTTAQWAAEDPILGDGEIGIVKETKEFKVGDGVSHWSALPYTFISRTVYVAYGDIVIGVGAGQYIRLPKGAIGTKLTVLGDGTIGWA